MYFCGIHSHNFIVMHTNYKIFILLSALLAGCAPRQHSSSPIQPLLDEAKAKADSEDYTSAHALLDSAYVIAEGFGDRPGQADVLLHKAFLYDYVVQPDSAVICLNRGLEVCPNITDSLRAQYYNELICANINLGEMQKATDLAQPTFPLIRRYGSDEDFAVFCGNIGIAYRRMGENDSAAVYYQRGLEVALQADDYANQAYLANNLSVLYSQGRRTTESIHYADKAMEAAVKAGDEVERVSAMANKGAALYLEKRYDDAVALLVRTYQQADSLSNPMMKIKSVTSLLSALSERPDAADADYYLRRADELAALLPPQNPSALFILEAKANLLQKKKRFADALLTLQEIEKANENYQLRPAYMLLFQKGICTAGQGRYEEAYRLMLDSYISRDSVQNLDSEAKLDKLSTDLRVMEKELQVARLNEEKAVAKRRVGILLAAIAVLALIIVSLLLWIRQRRQRAQIHEAQRYIDGIEQERTRFAHELHDGACNELLAMGMQLRATNPDIPEVCQQMSTLRSTLRNLSHELMPPQFNQGVKLNEALAYYLSHIEKPVVTFHAEGDGWATIPNNVSYQLYRIVQEAIGNIIVHQPEAKADVSLISTDGTLELVVTSTGEVKKGESKGIGMQSMRDRANSIGGALSVEQKKDVWSLKLSV